MSTKHTHKLCKEHVTDKLKSLGYTIDVPKGKKYHIAATKMGNTITMRVAGIKSAKSRWNLIEREPEYGYIVLVNLHADSQMQPEFYILSYKEADKEFRSETMDGNPTPRPWLRPSDKLNVYKDAWSKLK